MISADRLGAQIVKQLERGTMANYSVSWVWKGDQLCGCAWRVLVPDFKRSPLQPASSSARAMIAEMRIKLLAPSTRRKAYASMLTGTLQAATAGRSVVACSSGSTQPNG